MQDIRWKQRLNNYLKAFQALTESVELAQVRTLSRLEQQGLIREMTGHARNRIYRADAILEAVEASLDSDSETA